jgi:UDP-hydrolysing UDP-N-acetyl-D-glucosamine 2-epimerase
MDRAVGPVTGARRVVGVVSVSRSDWGHLVPVLDAMRAVAELELRLFVAGMHLSDEFGRTVDEIAAQGWPIVACVPMLEAVDTPAGIATSIARGVAGFAGVYAEHRPDLLVVLGDRFEMLAAAVAALPFALPVAHIHGGEVTEGAIDNQIRHAITKLAHLHFASAAEHGRRIAAMGEEDWRIHVVGAPGLDRVRTMTLLSREDIAAELGLPAAAPWIVVTFHPVTLEYAATADHVDALLDALDKVDAALVLTYPNADTAGRLIIQRLEHFAAQSGRVRLVRNLGDRLYLSLLRHADAMVGNSSSGLIEAPSFALPVINIGNRQRGRLRAGNVIDVPPQRDDILAAIQTAMSPAFRRRLAGQGNPYGDGYAAPRIVKVLREVTIDATLVQKRERNDASAH